MCIVKLLDILKSHELGLENKQYRHIKNFVTRKLFPQDAWQQIVDCEKNEDKIYDQMIKERLQFDSTTEVITRAKKLQLFHLLMCCGWRVSYVTSIARQNR